MQDKLGKRQGVAISSLISTQSTLPHPDQSSPYIIVQPTIQNPLPPCPLMAIAPMLLQLIQPIAALILTTLFLALVLAHSAVLLGMARQVRWTGERLVAGGAGPAGAAIGSRSRVGSGRIRGRRGRTREGVTIAVAIANGRGGIGGLRGERGTVGAMGHPNGAGVVRWLGTTVGVGVAMGVYAIAVVEITVAQIASRGTGEGAAHGRRGAGALGSKVSAIGGVAARAMVHPSDKSSVVVQLVQTSVGVASMVDSVAGPKWNNSIGALMVGDVGGNDVALSVSSVVGAVGPKVTDTTTGATNVVGIGSEQSFLNSTIGEATSTNIAVRKKAGFDIVDTQIEVSVDIV